MSQTLVRCQNEPGGQVNHLLKVWSTFSPNFAVFWILSMVVLLEFGFYSGTPLKGHP